MPKFKLLSDMFIEPILWKSGQTIDYTGPVNNIMEPLDDAARAMMDAYLATFPKATTSPVDDLPRTMASLVDSPDAQLVPVVAAPGERV